MAAKRDKKDAEVVCEFFGIEITTRNPKVARILTTDVGEALNTDILVVNRAPKDRPIFQDDDADY